MSNPQSPYYASPYGANVGAPPGKATSSHLPQQPPTVATRSHPQGPPPPQPSAGADVAAYPTYPHAPYPAQQQPSYPPSYPAFTGGAPTTAPATASPTPSSPHGSAAGSSAATPSYPGYPAYGGYAPSQQPYTQSQQPPQQPQPQHPYQQAMNPPPPPQYTQQDQQQAQQQPQQPQQPQPAAPSHAYVPHQPTQEEVVDEAIAATSQHWVKEQLRREAEKRYEKMYGKPAPQRHDSGDDDDGHARENAARHPSTSTGRGGAASLGTQQHVEFHVGSPRHVTRLSLLFLATFFGMVPLMSTFSFTVLLSGVVLVYICDYLAYHRATVFALLGTAGVFAMSLLLSNFHAAVTSFGPMLMILDLGVVQLMIVAAAVQHFRWVQETFPNVLCALERLVFAVAPVACLPSLLTTTTALVGSRYAPFFFYAIMCILHSFFYCPLKSSFLVLVSPKVAAGNAAAAAAVASSSAEGQDPQRQPDAGAAAGSGGGVYARRREGQDDHGPIRTEVPKGDAHGGERDDDDGASSEASAAAAGASYGAPLQLNEQVEALIFSLLVIILPVAVYSSFQNWYGHHLFGNLLNSLGLVCGGLAYFCVSPVHSLWFLASPPDSTYSLAQQLEYDPLGLMDLVGAYRIPVLTTVALTGVHWGVYRVLSSRYAYLFSGLPWPFNAIVLLLAFYIAAYVAIEIKKLIDVDNSGGDVTKGKYLLQRGPVLVGTCIAAILICVLTSAPGVFYFPCVLSVMGLNLFLTDRTNGGPMFTFTVFSSLLLLWWMYRTYSFMVLDLRVFGETTVVPTPVLAVSVLWCYILGCMSFTLIFSPNKTPATMTLFMLALQVTFVEHVLYSQKEEGVYPAVLVAFTSIVGIAVPCRLYANEALPVYSASLIASCYVAKFFTFLVEVTSAYYAEELNIEDRLHSYRAILLTAEITGGWWVCLFASHLIATFEIEKRRRVKMEAARRMIYSYAVCALLLSLLTIRNIQRATYEFVTQSYVSEQELPHIAVGTCCATFALLTLPVWGRLYARYPVVHPLRSISRGVGLLAVVLLAIQPTRVMEESVSDFDYDFEYADSGRYAAALGCLLLLVTRAPLLRRIPCVLRIAYWLVTAALLALGITGLVQAAPTFVFYLMMLGLVYTILLIVDVAHYREVSGTVLMVVYGLSVLLVPLSFLQFNRAVAAQQQQLRYSPDRMATLWDMYEQGSMRLLAVVVVVHLGLSVLINCRLSGRPLLPQCKEISRDSAMSLGVIANFSTELAVALLCALNFYGNDSEPVLYVLSSTLLLLFVNDEVMFFGLREQNFRYFPPTVCAFTLLWACTVWNAWRTGANSLSSMSQVQHVVQAVLQASITLPAQISLVVLLWKGRKVGSSPGFVVVGSVLLCLMCLFFISSKPIQWMAIVGIFGQCARLFDSQLQPSTGRRRRQSAY